MVDLKKVEEFFFVAMMNGYATGAQKSRVTDLPGCKEISFRDDDFCLRDRYFVNADSPKSAGTTVIWLKDQPVWFMSYGGFYEERAIPLLREALRETYGAQEFVGGRGPLVFARNNLIYTNSPRFNVFANFNGRENVHDMHTGELVGYHEYFGVSVL